MKPRAKDQKTPYQFFKKSSAVLLPTEGIVVLHQDASHGMSFDVSEAPKPRYLFLRDAQTSPGPKRTVVPDQSSKGSLIDIPKR